MVYLEPFRVKRVPETFTNPVEVGGVGVVEVVDFVVEEVVFVVEEVVFGVDVVVEDVETVVVPGRHCQYQSFP